MDYGDIEVIWTNFDILRTDDGLPYFTGSEPVPSDLPWAPKACSLYSYSGHMLPKLPARNMEEYPCVTLFHNQEGNRYYAYITEKAPVVAPEADDSESWVRLGGCGAILKPELQPLSDGTSQWFGLLPLIGGGTYARFLIWANTDIYTVDNNVYFYKSPSPLLLGESNHTVLQGWIVGKRLAAMRGQTQQVTDTARLGLATLGRMILGKE